MYVRKYVYRTSISWRELDNCSPHGCPPVLEIKMGKRRKILQVLSVEPKGSPLALDRMYVCTRENAGDRIGPLLKYQFHRARQWDWKKGM